MKALIDASRQRLAISVNAELTMLYWQIGWAINTDVLQQSRADYGKQTVLALARQLSAEYGGSFSEKNLRRMMQFADVFPEKEIVVSLMRQLSWTHLLALIPIKDPLKRAFYAEMCRLDRWSVRALRQHIDAMLYERTAVSRKPEAAIAQDLTTLRETDQLTPDLVFRDTYVLDFLGLPAAHSEATLEKAVVGRLQEFILEMGQGFSFLERQKRISVDDTDYYLDLLFYHRKLRRLVAIDLKLGKFRPEHKGQMELYLRWLDRYDRQEGELPPIGLLLCSEGNTEHVELLLLDQSDIRVAHYLTELPPKEWFEQKLHKAIELARQQLDQHSL
ncbi:PDDEXK nuclease domain-containing protein [Hymenobacter metallilatus]|uniref:PDDEXK nuclease domain-containing protein n=1 Tax=Hymenobacter metallilatus TaxID=2493666 RepID=UPI001FEA7440|nr:PDDEXK nuclease domain-containing protein [Hymenobacter metallilatus]